MTSSAPRSPVDSPSAGLSRPQLANGTPRHQHSASSSGLVSNKSRRSLAALARDKVVGLAGIGTTSPQTLRSTTSSNSLQTQQQQLAAGGRPALPRNITSPPAIVAGPQTSNEPLPSMAQSSKQPPIMKPAYQGSSTQVDKTLDGRMFVKDLKDIFASMISTVKIGDHRVKFRKVEDTFMSEDAMDSLKHLTLKRVHKTNDPAAPEKAIQTIYSTTFSMGLDTARTTLQQFVDARFLEPADGKVYSLFPTQGVVWKVTSKGIQILKRWVDRNGSTSPQIDALIRKAQMSIVVLERDSETDRVSHDKTTIELVFRRMCGIDGPNLKPNTTLSDSDSVSEYVTGMIGVKMARDRRVMGKPVPYTFTGKAGCDWLLDCCTTIDRREPIELCEQFVRYGLIVPVIEDKQFIRAFPSARHFQPTKVAIYAVTEKGQRTCGWIARPPSVSSEDSAEGEHDKLKMPRDSNMSRFNMIMKDPALRMLFREHLSLSLCEENLNFYTDVQTLLRRFHELKERDEGVLTYSHNRECLATAYSKSFNRPVKSLLTFLGLYNSFLASGAPSELNIDHSLRTRLDLQMIRTDVGNDEQREQLDKIMQLIELAATSVAKLMASDSVPKFMRDPRYATIIRNHQVDQMAPQRAVSPAPSPSGGSTSTLETAPSPASTVSDKPVLSRSNTSMRAQASTAGSNPPA